MSDRDQVGPAPREASPGETRRDFITRMAVGAVAIPSALSIREILTASQS